MISQGILQILPPNFTKFVYFFVTAKKLSSNLESLYFPTFSTKCRECKIGKRDGHGKSRNGHGKVMEKMFCQVCGNPVNDKIGRAMESTLTFGSVTSNVSYPRILNTKAACNSIRAIMFL